MIRSIAEFGLLVFGFSFVVGLVFLSVVCVSDLILRYRIARKVRKLSKE